MTLLRLCYQEAETEPNEEQAMKTKLTQAGAAKVTCRLCKGDHYTARCPYKDSLGALDASGSCVPPSSSHTWLKHVTFLHYRRRPSDRR